MGATAVLDGVTWGDRAVRAGTVGNPSRLAGVSAPPFDRDALGAVYEYDQRLFKMVDAARDLLPKLLYDGARERAAKSKASISVGLLMLRDTPRDISLEDCRKGCVELALYCIAQGFDPVIHDYTVSQANIAKTFPYSDHPEVAVHTLAHVRDLTDRGKLSNNITVMLRVPDCKD